MERVRHSASRGPQAFEAKPIRLARGRTQLVERKAEAGVQSNADHHDR
jgi:hypothetical protein